VAERAVLAATGRQLEIVMMLREWSGHAGDITRDFARGVEGGGSSRPVRLMNRA